MILIGDAGGSKTDWRVIHVDGQIDQFSTGPFHFHGTNVDLLVKELDSIINTEKVKNLYLYQAGLKSDKNKSDLKEALSAHFKNAEVSVENDQLGAARAMCGKEPGYIGILGTGSAMIYYDGKTAKSKVQSLGYVIGDEGSGTYLGKRFLAYLFRDCENQTLKGQFETEFGDLNSVLENLYSKDRGNQYLASFAPFILNNVKQKSVYDIVYSAFANYFDIFLGKIDMNMSIHFVGSIAFHFSSQLRQVASDKGISVGMIAQSPIAGLTLYHKH